jgi:hypothetical protein
LLRKSELEEWYQQDGLWSDLQTNCKHTTRSKAGIPPQVLIAGVSIGYRHLQPDEVEPAGVAPAEKFLPLQSGARSGLVLCLSGGGFRAALFHVGALRRLNELGILARIDEISSVSGGSIVAVQLATVLRPWPVEPLIDFESNVAAPLREFTRRNLRTIPMLKRLLPWIWYRSSTGVEGLAETYWDAGWRFIPPTSQ